MNSNAVPVPVHLFHRLTLGLAAVTGLLAKRPLADKSASFKARLWEGAAGCAIGHKANSGTGPEPVQWYSIVGQAKHRAWCRPDYFELFFASDDRGRFAKDG